MKTLLFNTPTLWMDQGWVLIWYPPQHQGHIEKDIYLSKSTQVRSCIAWNAWWSCVEASTTHPLDWCCYWTSPGISIDFRHGASHLSNLQCFGGCFGGFDLDDFWLVQFLVKFLRKSKYQRVHLTIQPAWHVASFGNAQRHPGEWNFVKTSYPHRKWPAQRWLEGIWFWGGIKSMTNGHEIEWKI